MKNRQKKKILLFLRHDFRKWQAILFTVLAMAVLICFVYFCKIPNPNMILIAGLVICSAFFGFAGGIPAALIMLAYTLWFFSAGQNGGQFMVFSGNNLSKVFVSFFGIVVDMLFVCILKINESAAYREVKMLSEELKLENELLLEQSRVDALTGVGNRLALRYDFDSYTGKKLRVIMIDIDNFKSINDTYSHAVGDEALRKTGALLSQTFGKSCCYRYGGDEFLVIIPDEGEERFGEQIAQMNENSPSIEAGGDTVNISYSFGDVSGVGDTAPQFRALLKSADEKMYELKKQKKLGR